MTAAASAFARVVKPVTHNIPQAGGKFNAETEKFSVFSTISITETIVFCINKRFDKLRRNLGDNRVSVSL